MQQQAAREGHRSVLGVTHIFETTNQPRMARISRINQLRFHCRAMTTGSPDHFCSSERERVDD